MIVDINLLPKKQARDITTPVIIGVSAFLILFTVIALVTVNYFVQKDIERSSVTLEQTVQLRMAMEEVANQPLATSSLVQLQTSIDWAEQQSIDMVPILNHLVSLLPEAGFMDHFTYNVTGAINMTVSFKAPRDGAYYLHHLNASPYVQEASLAGISSNEEETTGVYTVQLNREYVKEQQKRGDR